MQVIIILLIILAVLLVIFTLQNSMEITLNVFLWEITNAPLVLVLVSCVVLGYILASVYFYPKLWKIKKEYKQLIKFNKELKELHDLNHPFDEEEKNPEGIELDDDDSSSFFKD
ncbi:lipopolysaccharide assembly protein LapA domain-containing protein [Draconibacterium sp.]|nr:lipopolysaccharide assembly protein LapA domain-containing protein [Draconibacterium sp.]